LSSRSTTAAALSGLTSIPQIGSMTVSDFIPRKIGVLRLSLQPTTGRDGEKSRGAGRAALRDATIVLVIVAEVVHSPAVALALSFAFRFKPRSGP
jgi:hypothetical protein